MYKLVLILLIPLFLTQVYTEKEKYWDRTNMLTWSDFQGKPDSNSKYMASTTCEIVCRMETTDSEALVTVYCFFNTKESWTKTDDTYLLNHEQRHFDLYEAYTRKMRQALMEISETDVRKIASQVKRIYDRYFRECSRNQDRYDSETQFSNNREKQQEWNRRIDMLIQETETLTDPVIRISL